MNEKQIGTALLSAYIRGYHAEYDTPKIFDDFLAFLFLSQEERALIEKQLAAVLQSVNPELASSFPDRASALKWFMQASAGSPLILGRARYAEDSLEESLRKGIKQYVILGAGLDTFAFRRLELVEQLQVFEVDHPVMQAFKRRRLAELGWKHPAQLHFIPMDFTQDNLATALKRSPYTPQALSFFNWLGVTYYLPRDIVFSILRTIAELAPAGSMVIFDYLDSDAFVPEKVAPRVQGMLWLAQRDGVPWITGFDPSILAADLKPIGLHLSEDLSPSEIQERYFTGREDNYQACEHLHFAYAVVE